MRPPERMRQILDLVHKIWEYDSDMRFFQLIYVLQAQYCQAHYPNGAIKSPPRKDVSEHLGFDLFVIEDTQIIKFLENRLLDLKSKQA